MDDTCDTDTKSWKELAPNEVRISIDTKRHRRNEKPEGKRWQENTFELDPSGLITWEPHVLYLNGLGDAQSTLMDKLLLEVMTAETEPSFDGDDRLSPVVFVIEDRKNLPVDTAIALAALHFAPPAHRDESAAVSVEFDSPEGVESLLLKKIGEGFFRSKDDYFTLSAVQSGADPNLKFFKADYTLGNTNKVTLFSDDRAKIRHRNVAESRSGRLVPSSVSILACSADTLPLAPKKHWFVRQGGQSSADVRDVT